MVISVAGGDRFSIEGANAGPAASIHFSDLSAVEVVARDGDAGLAQTYLDGQWQTPDLCAVLAVVESNPQVMQSQWFLRPLEVLLGRRGVRKQVNIHKRYDLDNAFYASWLDATMAYSAACYDGVFSRTLEDAQRAKYERILALLDPQPGTRLLDVGCGWGGFAAHAALTRGCSVYGATLSPRQVEHGRLLIQQCELEERANIEVRDFRDIVGQYDSVVSIEMIETLRKRDWVMYFDCLAKHLKRDGHAVVQASVTADDRAGRSRSRANFIQRYVAANAELASTSQLTGFAQASGFEMRSLHRFGSDYAQTLKVWRDAFNRNWPAIENACRDAAFHRLWNYYLAHCEAGFRSGNTDVIQLEMVLH